MSDNKILAELVRQAEGEGVDRRTVAALVEEASERGAARALSALGLSDAAAGGDIVELRELLRSWRDVKRSARRAFVDWIVKLILALMVVALAVKLEWRA